MTQPFWGKVCPGCTPAAEILWRQMPTRVISVGLGRAGRLCDHCTRAIRGQIGWWMREIVAELMAEGHDRVAAAEVYRRLHDRAGVWIDPRDVGVVCGPHRTRPMRGAYHRVRTGDSPLRGWDLEPLADWMGVGPDDVGAPEPDHLERAPWADPDGPPPRKSLTDS